MDKIFLVKAPTTHLCSTKDKVELSPQEVELLKDWIEEYIDNMETAGFENKEEREFYTTLKNLLKKLESLK